MRSPERTSFTSRIERGRPTASGVSVSGNGTVSCSGRTGSAAGIGCPWRSRMASSMSAPSTTSMLGPPSSDPRSPGMSPARRSISALRRRALLLAGLDGDGAAGRAPRAQRQLDAQDAVLVRGLGILGDDVRVQLEHAPEGARLDLDLLVDAALGLLNRTLAADDEVATDDLEPNGVEAHAGKVHLHDRLRGLAAVVDVHARRETGLPPPGKPAGTTPDVAEELVHLAPHALEVDEGIPFACHEATLATVVGGLPGLRYTSYVSPSRAIST